MVLKLHETLSNRSRGGRTTAVRSHQSLLKDNKHLCGFPEPPAVRPKSTAVSLAAQNFFSPRCPFSGPHFSEFASRALFGLSEYGYPFTLGFQQIILQRPTPPLHQPPPRPEKPSPCSKKPSPSWETSSSQGGGPSASTASSPLLAATCFLQEPCFE